jgi:hypothetical protein
MWECDKCGNVGEARREGGKINSLPLVMFTRTILLVAFFAFASCGKEENAPVQATLTETLTSVNWKLFKQNLVFADGSSADLTNITFKPCELDDILSFGKDGVFRKSEGALICNPPGGSVFNYLNGAPWVVQDSTLIITAGFNIQEYKVTAWSNTSMTWKQPYTNYLGEKETYVYEMRAQ